MKWNLIFGRKDTLLPVWAALCEAIADGSDPRYPSGARHALVVMVCCDKKGLEDKTRGLLGENGWIRPVITSVKRLEHPFHSDDPTMLACYAGAVEKDGGIIVYQDSIPDQQT
ncbi:MAG TPA: hypothetical protein VHX11_06700 [Acidobacteriaceae bacterium]|jgi:hypothetical protein|nr:hypothetical protein [Acidobacteriaceae bacterium]